MAMRTKNVVAGTRLLAVLVATGMILLAGLAAEGNGSPANAPAAVQPAGWRGDGTGQHPSATPPLGWSDTSNVAWKATVGGSYSSPVVVGDRVMVTAEPDRVLCLNVGDGKVLWS
ncbi:MAG: PQQ-binding-like beta-propeller repeat protein, partial [bacterium]